MNRILPKFLVAAISLLALCTALVAPAADIPSSAIGDYNGAENACRIEPYAIAAGHRALDVKCVRPNDRQTTGVSVVNGCPTTDTLVPLTQWGGESGQDKASMKLEEILWIDGHGRYVKSTGWGIASKFPNEWIRVVAIGDGTLSVRIGSFQALQGPDGGSLLLFTRSATHTQQFPYPGCGAVQAAGPLSAASCPWFYPTC